MSNHSIIEHRASYYFIKVEEDFLAICSNGKCSPHCKALILAILEHWMITKRARGEGNYVYLTIPQWIKHTYMLYERNVIIDCLHELLEEGLIIRRQIIIHDQKTFEYTLNVDTIHEHIKRLPSKPDKETLPNLDPYLAYKARGKAAREAEKAKKKGVGEKSTTPVENSTTVIEKSTRVGEKSTQQRIRTQIPNRASNKDSKGRENDAPLTNSTPEGSSLSSNPSEPLIEIILSPEARHVFDLVCQVLYEYGPPEITVQVQEQCNKLVSAGIKTLEDIQALVRICKQIPKLKDATILYLGNLANTNVLNGWKQIQKKTEAPTTPIEKPKQITNVQEWLQMLEYNKREEAAQKEGSII